MGIPIIDLGRYMAGAPGALDAAAAELRAALEGIGFFIVVNHGVSPDLIGRAFAEARRFHAQPYGAKIALRLNEHNNG
jgi:isopenicillin N synthase-like dioxygenase